MEKTQKQTTKKRQQRQVSSTGFANAIAEFFKLKAAANTNAKLAQLVGFAVNQGKYWSSQQVKNAWRRKTQRYRINDMRGGRK